MKKGKRVSHIFAAAGLVLVFAAGFAFGFDTGRIINDRDRIKTELTGMSVDEITKIAPVAKSKEGRLEIKMLHAYLEEYKKQRDRIIKCNEQLKNMDEKARAEMTVFDVSELLDVNIDSYKILKSLTEEPEKYFTVKLKDDDKESYIAWVDDWSEDVFAVNGLLRQPDDHITELYQENIDYLEQINLLL